MNATVYIQGFAAAQDTIWLNLPYYLKSGCDLVGLDGPDSHVACWPSCFKSVMAVGPPRDESKSFHPIRLVAAFRKALESDASWFIFTEYDSIFLAPVPNPPVDWESFGAFIAGYCPESWGCGDGPFLHPPFVVYATTAARWEKAACSLIKRESFGNGTPDVFAAMACQEAGIPIVNLPNVWSTNGLDMRVASKLIAARKSAEAGCWHIHGVKRQDHLDFILGKSEVFPADTIME